MGGAARFNERMVLSLATNPAALLMDDEMNVLPTSTHVKSIMALPRDEEGRTVVEGPSVTAAVDLADLRASLADTQVPTQHRPSHRILAVHTFQSCTKLLVTPVLTVVQHGQDPFPA